MKKITRSITAAALFGLLGTGVALAASPTHYADEVETSSIKLPQSRSGGQAEDQTSLQKLATVTQAQAEAAAIAAQPDGKVLKSRLEEEHGYLVWQIDVEHGKKETQFSVDPGTGQVLAAESESRHSDEHHNKM
jgi:uncharacterized membrane protein YkoI